jgi:hypothetical protein
VIILGSQATLPDGPTIAIAGDGQFAIAAWDGNGIQYKIPSNIQNDGGMSIPSDQTGVQGFSPPASPLLQAPIAITRVET